MGALHGNRHRHPDRTSESLTPCHSPFVLACGERSGSHYGCHVFSLFGALALVIAVMELYSAISYSVVQRRHEFGVRLALGARVADVDRIVMTYGLRPVVVGIVLGTALAAAAGPAISSLLFQTSPRDPIIFVVMAVSMLAVAVVASVVPARRAARVDPATALRGD